jgi:hypothetical protein
MEMSDTEKEAMTTQSDKNTFDIRQIKAKIPIIWAIGVLIAGSGIVYGIATRSANKENNDANYKADNARSFADMKMFVARECQSIRAKDSTDIADNHKEMLNALNIYQITTNGEIKLLREECRKGMMPYGEHYYYSPDGSRHVAAVKNK